MSAQVSIENVSFQYPGGVAPVLKNVSLTIEQGDFMAIVGGNGSGKSTLCKLLNGLIPHYCVGDFYACRHLWACVRSGQSHV